MRFVRQLLACMLATAAGAAGAAGDEQYGSWMIGSTDNGGNFAATMNDSGGVLGKTCDSGGCNWVMTLKAGCEAGSTYSGLLSAQSGAAAIRLRCAPNKTSSAGRYIIEEFAVMEDAVRTGDQLGIAIPLKSGEFRVARYPIGGWSDASTHLAARVSVMLKRSGESSL